MMNGHINSFYQPMTSRNLPSNLVQNSSRTAPKTEYIKEDVTLLDRLPTDLGFHLESEISHSIGQDGQISDIKR